MSDFERRWRRLARVASRAEESAIPPAPDGAVLQRRAAALARSAPPARSRPLASAVAIALLWVVALPAASSAWRTAHDVLARLAVSAPAPTCCPSLPPPPVPSTFSPPALGPPRLPAPPDLWPLPSWVNPLQPVPPEEMPS